jgi:hypothetical protein
MAIGAAMLAGASLFGMVGYPSLSDVSELTFAGSTFLAVCATEPGA